MEFQFTIPQQNDELLNYQGNNYCVKEVYNSNRLQDLFKCKLTKLICYSCLIIDAQFRYFISNNLNNM